LIEIKFNILLDFIKVKTLDKFRHAMIPRWKKLRNINKNEHFEVNDEEFN